MTETSIVLPAEWQAQSGVMLTWPHKQSDWKDSLQEIESVYLQMVAAITRDERCLLVCYDEAHKDHVKTLLKKNNLAIDACSFVNVNTNDTWCRDYAPITTLNEAGTVLNNFEFNGWGKKYAAELDNAVTSQLVESRIFDEHDIMQRDFVLEGGSIETNGKGTFLTTSECLLKRHPEMSRTDIETLLSTELGAQHINWVDYGSLSGDDTDSHIDNLARFSNESTIMYCACMDKAHPDYPSLKLMEEQLQDIQQQNGKSYILIPVELPAPIYHDGELLPASYMNFLIINHAVLVPVFGCAQDDSATEIFRQQFPDRRIIPIDSNALIKQRGGIHCATMHFPAGVLA